MSVCSRWAGAAGAEKGEGKEGGPPPGVDGRGCGGRGLGGYAGATKRKGDLRA